MKGMLFKGVFFHPRTRLTRWVTFRAEPGTELASSARDLLRLERTLVPLWEEWNLVEVYYLGEVGEDAL